MTTDTKSHPDKIIRINVRVTEEFRTLAHRLAERKGISLSALIHLMITEQARKEGLIK